MGRGPHPGDVLQGTAGVAALRRALLGALLAVLRGPLHRGRPLPPPGTHPRAESFPPLEDPRSLAENGRFDEYLALWSLLDQLLPDRRRAFVLTQVEGLPYAEAAELLKVPVGTVRSRVARARQHLIEMLRAAE